MQRLVAVRHGVGTDTKTKKSRRTVGAQIPGCHGCWSWDHWQAHCLGLHPCCRYWHRRRRCRHGPDPVPWVHPGLHSAPPGHAALEHSHHIEMWLGPLGCQLSNFQHITTWCEGSLCHCHYHSQCHSRQSDGNGWWSRPAFSSSTAQQHSNGMVRTKDVQLHGVLLACSILCCVLCIRLIREWAGHNQGQHLQPQQKLLMMGSCQPHTVSLRPVSSCWRGDLLAVDSVQHTAAAHNTQIVHTHLHSLAQPRLVCRGSSRS